MIGFPLAAAVLFLLLYGRIPTWPLAAGIVLLCAAGLLLHKHAGHRHGGLLSIDVYAQRSKLGGWHAGMKLCLAVACAFICVTAKPTAVALFILLAMTAMTVGAGRTPMRRYVSLLFVPSMFILLSGLALLIEITRQPLGLLDIPVGAFYLSVTEHGQAAAFAVMIRALGAVSCLYMLSLSTPAYHIVDALRRFKLPPVVIELMYLIYRYLFILLEAHENMTAAAEARLGYRDFRTSAGTMPRSALNLFFVSLRRTSGSLSAMEARCYDGEIRFYGRPQRIGGIQIVVTAALPVAAAGVWAVSGGWL